MTARHSSLFTLESGNSGLSFYTTQRDAAELPAPALQRGEPNAQKDSQLVGTGAISNSIIEDL
jgi:hypothetical protein